MTKIDKKKLAFLFYLGADLVDVINLTGTLRSVKIPLQNANKTIKASARFIAGVVQTNCLTLTRVHF